MTKARAKHLAVVPEPTLPMEEALSIINRSDLTPEQKLRLEEEVLTDSTGPRNLADSPPMSGDSSPQSSAPNEVLWEPRTEWNTLREEDYPTFVQETTRQFLGVLGREMVMLQDLHQAQAKAQGPGLLVIEKELASYEIARLVAVQLLLGSSPPPPDLLVPDKNLVDANGNPLGSHHDA